VQEEENMNPDQGAAVEASVETTTQESSSQAAPTSEPPPAEVSSDDDKPTRTLKLNRSADSSAEPAATEQATSGESSADSDAPVQEEGENQGGGRNRRNRNRRNRREPHVPSENPMSLTELKTKSTQELIDMAAEMGIENMARSRKQDIIFSLLKRHAKSGEDIFGDGVLEILSDGFGFLRSAATTTSPHERLNLTDRRTAQLNPLLPNRQRRESLQLIQMHPPKRRVKIKAVGATEETATVEIVASRTCRPKIP